MKDPITTPSPKVEKCGVHNKTGCGYASKAAASKTRHCAKKERVHLPRRHAILRITGKHHTRIGLVTAQCKGKLIAPFTYSEAMKAPLSEQRFKDELVKVLPKAAPLS